MWIALNNGEAANAIAYVVDAVTTYWKEQHLRISEIVKQEAVQIHLKELQRDFEYAHALQQWLKFLDTAGTRSYEIDDLTLKILDGLVSATV